MQSSKRVFLVLAISIFMIASLYLTLRCSNNHGIAVNNPKINIDYRRSYFNDFYFDDHGNVIFKCAIFVINKSDEKQQFYLKLDVGKEKARGLVSGDLATAHEAGKTEFKKFTIEPKTEKSFEVFFSAPAGKTKTKLDRSLPGKIIVQKVK